MLCSACMYWNGVLVASGPLSFLY